MAKWFRKGNSPNSSVQKLFGQLPSKKHIPTKYQYATSNRGKDKEQCYFIQYDRVLCYFMGAMYPGRYFPIKGKYKWWPGKLVAVGVGVFVANGVLVAVGKGVAVGVIVGFGSVGVLVDDGVAVLVWVGVDVAVFVGVGLGVAVLV
jgi:hypothetical protein